MSKKKFILFSITVTLSLSVWSQIEVLPNRSVNFGEYSEEFINGEDDENCPILYIGPNYGGFYFQRLTNFFQISRNWLYMYVAGTGNKVVFYNTQTESHNAIICYDGFYSDFTDFEEEEPHEEGAPSDDLIETSQEQKSALSLLSGLKPVTFRWKKETSPEKLSGKEGLSYGFLAQDVAKVFPMAVSTDSVGEMMLNYNAILPVVATSLQELQGQMLSQQNELNGLSQAASQEESVSLTVAPVVAGDEIQVSYALAQKYSNAFILITSKDNKVIKKLTLNDIYGRGSVDVPSKGIGAGLYNCSLFADDKILGNTNLIITSK